MGRIATSRTTATTRRAALQRGLLALMLLGALTLTLGVGLAPLASASPERAALEGDDTPGADVAGPRIDSVSSTDVIAVRPDDMTNDDAAPTTVSGLPASGIGFTVPADDDVRHWTNLTMLALSINALILASLAIRSLRRRT